MPRASSTLGRCVRPASLRTELLADALQLLGIGQAALDMSVDYVRQRHQFGQPVGAQQAVKNQLADALIALEFACHGPARRLRLAGARGGHRRPRERLLDPRDRGGTAGGARRIASARRDGYSIEYPLHQLLKRSWSPRAAHGGVSEHRAQAQEWFWEGTTNDGSVHHRRRANARWATPRRPGSGASGGPRRTFCKPSSTARRSRMRRSTT